MQEYFVNLVKLVFTNMITPTAVAYLAKTNLNLRITQKKQTIQAYVNTNAINGLIKLTKTKTVLTQSVFKYKEVEG